jgi:Zn-dependent M16 (insulinase) family peptidase
MGPLDNKIQKIIDADSPDLPLFIHFEHVETNFVHLTMIIGTGNIPTEKRPLLAMYLLNFFNSPIMRDGKRIEFEQVVIELERDTVSYAITSGAFSGSPESLAIRFQVEPEKYETAVKWVKEMLWDSIFDEVVCTSLHDLVSVN